MKIADFLALRWEEAEGPLIEPPRFSPVIADPSFLFPEETPEGDWALFAHSAWGIHRYASEDGLAWRDRGIVARNAMRPFVRRLGGSVETAGRLAAAAGIAAAGAFTGAAGDSTYALYFESYPLLALPLSALPIRRPWNSTIGVARSVDLKSWSRREKLLGPDQPWMGDPSLGDSVSNPCLVEEPKAASLGKSVSDIGWRLYYSASLSWIPDCGFCEPRYITCARGPSPTGPFAPEPAPIIDPATDPMQGVLGAGSMKAIAMDDGWIGLQNKIYRDSGGNSRSAIFILRSEDGFAWSPARADPLIAPGSGWNSSHVYACDCRFREKEGLWYLYFNARDGWKLSEGRERIGRILGRS
jgi:hypothetical protein